MSDLFFKHILMSVITVFYLLKSLIKLYISNRNVKRCIHAVEILEFSLFRELYITYSKCVHVSVAFV